MIILQVGPFEYNPTTGTLVKDGEEQVLRHQVNLLLKMFVENEGVLLSREDLMARIWPQNHVETNTFFQCMNHLRKALGETSGDPTFIKNYPRKGYVWMRQVKAPPRKKIRDIPFRVKLGLTAALILAGMVFLWSRQTGSSKSQAMPPIENSLLQAPKATALPVGEAVPAVFNPTSREPLSSEQDEPLDLNLGRRMAGMGGDYAQHFALAKFSFERGDPLACERILSQLLARATEANFIHAKAMALLSLGKVSRFRQPMVAKQYLSEAKTHYFNLGDQKKFSEATYFLILIHLEIGEWEPARTLLQQDLKPKGRRNGHQRQYFVLASALLQLKTGEVDTAQHILDRGKNNIMNRRLNKLTLQLGLLEAAISMTQGQYDQAIRLNQQVISQAEDIGQPFIRLQALWMVSQAEALSQNPESAKQHFTQLNEAAKLFEMNFFLAKTTWTQKQFEPNQLTQDFRPESDHQLLIERLVMAAGGDSLATTTQLFNL